MRMSCVRTWQLDCLQWKPCPSPAWKWRKISSANEPWTSGRIPTYLPAKKDAWKYAPTAPQPKLHSICNQLARFRCFFGLSLPKETVQNNLSVSTVTFSKPRMEKVSSHHRILSIGSFMSSGFSWCLCCSQGWFRLSMHGTRHAALKLRNVSKKTAPPHFRRALASWVVPSWAAVLKTNRCVACWARKALRHMRKSNLNQWPLNVCLAFKPRTSFHHCWLLTSKPPGRPSLTCWIRAIRCYEEDGRGMRDEWASSWAMHLFVRRSFHHISFTFTFSLSIASQTKHAICLQYAFNMPSIAKVLAGQVRPK